MKLELSDVTVKLGDTPIVTNVNIKIKNGDFVGLIGLNGTGKSTLLKAIYGINKYEGIIMVDGRDCRFFTPKELAQRMAVLIQENSSDFDFKVKDIVLLGRLPYKGIFDDDNVLDFQIVDRALNDVGMKKYAERYYNSLSGGEKQRVLIARVLAQQTGLLILDEPTNHLDVKNQFSFFEMLKGLNMTVFAVLHDLNLAAKFCDYIYLISDKRIYAEGKPCDLFTEKLLEDVFGMRAKIYVNENKVHINYISAT